MKNLTAALVLSALASSPALAWGEREQGILAGAAGALIIQKIFENDRQAQVVPQPQIVVPPQQPQVIVVPPQQPTQIVGCVVTVQDQHGRVIRSESRACVQSIHGVTLY
jgi:hypothetical protein